MRLLSELVGALGAGALVFVLSRQLGFSKRRALGAVAIVPVAVATVLALPLLNQARSELRAEAQAHETLTAGEAQVKTGAEAGFAVEFFGWAGERIGEDETVHFEIGALPDEVFVGDVGVRQGAILQWGMYQLAPRLAVEQSPKARDLEPGEGRGADWIVFYESDPADFGAPLEQEMTYAPGYGIARSAGAG